MTQTTSSPTGETRGTAERPPHSLAESVATFDLMAELEQLRREATWQRGDRNAKTLYKDADEQLVLTAMKAGTMLREHRAAGRCVIQTITGRLRLGLTGRTVDLPVGHLLVLEPNLLHDVEAVEESAFLLTIARSAASVV